MKIRLEHQKTSLRLSKDEFSQLLLGNELHDRTIFPDGTIFMFKTSLSDKPGLTFLNQCLSIELPTRDLKDHKPDKRGLSFYFQLDNDKEHELLLEVDIKKKPLGLKRPVILE